MAELILTTYDWVPEGPRGLVRDFRLRWALEEAGLPYRVASTPLRERGAEHFAHQPFGQVPWLTDGDLSLFESGAMLLHVGEKSELLLPRDPAGRAATLSWLFAALNSVEIAVLPAVLYNFAKDQEATPGRELMDGFLAKRLEHMDRALTERAARGEDWLVGRFTLADIAMADVLRLTERIGLLDQHPACHAYVERARARPAFQKGMADQLAHFAAAD